MDQKHPPSPLAISATSAVISRDTPLVEVDGGEDVCDGRVIACFAADLLVDGFARGSDHEGTAELPGVSLHPGLPESLSHGSPDVLTACGPVSDQGTSWAHASSALEVLVAADTCR